MSPPIQKKSGVHRHGRVFWSYLLFIVFLSFFTYVYRYNYPQNPFWDEPYHIASAEKYLNGVYFMEQHPPLGKLLIALGEKIVDANQNDSQFIGTDYARDIPEDFSFAGYRLLPTLLGWFSAIVLFFLFFFFTKNPAVSTLLSFLYIFDNAQIVHSRGAMVDSPLTFFGLLTLLVLLHLSRMKKSGMSQFVLLSVIAGMSFGAVMTTKLVGLIFILAFLWALFELRSSSKHVLTLTLGALLGFVMVFTFVWHTHFRLGSSIQPALSDGGYYQASEEYKQILLEGKNGRFSSFSVMLRDSMKYVSHYNKGVPRLDMCKPEENGSPSYFWPFGAKTINFRWSQSGEETRYLYLVANPVGWSLGFIGVFLATAMVLCSWLLGAKIELQHRSEMLLLLAMYWGYMIAVSQLGRVMYLYHYFVPLTLSFLLFGLVFLNLQKLGAWKLTESRKMLVLTILGFLIFLSFQYYRPLSYYLPLTDEDVEDRALLPLWELRCAKCERENSLLVPRSSN